MRNDCPDGMMRDRLPDYVHGTLSDEERAVVAGHLAACADCSAEVELIAAAARAFDAPAVDLARIVAALPGAPKRTAPMHRPRTMAFARAAAAVVVLAVGAFTVTMLRGRPAASKHSATTAEAARGAGPALVAVAPSRAAEQPVAESSASVIASRTAGQTPAARRAVMSFGGGLSDLTDEQLDTLLGELDGIEALPSTEPETHLTPILPPGDGSHGLR